MRLCHLQSLECATVPRNSQSGFHGGDGVTIDDLQGPRSETTELWNVLDVEGVRDGRRETDMQLHQKVRGNLHIERLREVGRLQPRGDAPDSRRIDLNDAARARRQVLPEMAGAVETFADGDRQAG